jgi:hypothetical protein
VSYSDASVTVNNTVTTDQRSGTRVAPCDIGAFEAGASLTAPPSANPIFLGTPAPGALALTGTNGSTATTTISVENVGGTGTALNVAQVSLTAGYSVTGLPVSALASGASTDLTVQCTVGTSGPGALVVGTNESPAKQYTYAFTCSNPAATAPLFASNPVAGTRLAFAPDGTLHLTVTNQGPAGTLLDVANVSSNPGFTIASGLPITGLGSGQSAVIIVNFDPANQTGSPGLLALQTNERGTPIHEFLMPLATDIPTLNEWMLLALCFALGLLGCLRLTR